MAKQRDNISGSGGGDPEAMMREVERMLTKMERKALRKRIEQSVEEGAKKTIKTAKAETGTTEKVADEKKVRDREYRIGFAMNDIEAGIAKALEAGKKGAKRVRERVSHANKLAQERAAEGKARAKKKMTPYEAAKAKKGK